MPLPLRALAIARGGERGGRPGRNFERGAKTKKDSNWSITRISTKHEVTYHLNFDKIIAEYYNTH